MKKVVCLLCAMCICSMPVVCNTLQIALERQVLEKEQEQYASRQRFEMAVEYFQFYAKYNEQDKDGFIKGTFDLAQAYYAAAKGHSTLYAIELYGYMDRRMERPWQWGERTVASYVLKSLKKKAKKAEPSQKEIYNQIQNLMRPIHENRKLYFPLVWEFALTRANLTTLEMSAPVAQGEISWEDLTPAQIHQMKEGVARLNNLAKQLSQARPELLQMVAQGLQQDPLRFKNCSVNLGKFLVRYGMYNRNQDEGSVMVKAGKQLLAASK